MKTMFWCAVAAWTLGMSRGIAQDYPDLQTDRPDQTESSSVVPVRSLQLEAGVVYEEDRQEMIVHTHLHRGFAAPSVLARYGLLEWLELRVAGEHLLDMSQQLHVTPAVDEQVDNQFAWSVGGKIQLLREEGGMPEAALIAEVAMPDGANPAIPGFRLALSNTLAPGIGFGYNVGGEFDTDAESFAEGFTGIYTAALGLDLTESLGSYIELFGAFRDRALPEHSCDAGVTWLLSPNMQFDLAGGLGISGTAPDYFLTTGISVRIP